jgi:predicted RNase H-like HicB family nuclease
MITYKAMYKIEPDGVHAEVLDFPGAISCAATLDEARQWLASALVDMAETHLLEGEPLPVPNPKAHDPEADIEEPIYLVVSATSHMATAQVMSPT